MKTTCTVVLVTAPNLRTARALARLALDARLAACVNLIPAIESHYWWEGRLESSREILLLLKTTNRRVPALKKLILEKHPYQTAEFLALTVSYGAQRYLDWIVDSVRPAR